MNIGIKKINQNRMKSKEKAKELVDNFIDKMFYLRDGYNAIEVFSTAKQCALIAVDEIMLAIPDASDDDSPYNDELKYWQQVKHEIINL